MLMGPKFELASDSFLEVELHAPWVWITWASGLPSNFPEIRDGGSFRLAQSIGSKEYALSYGPISLLDFDVVQHWREVIFISKRDLRFQHEYSSTTDRMRHILRLNNPHTTKTIGKKTNTTNQVHCN